MKNKRKPFSIDIPLLITALIAASVLRSVAVIRELDYEYGYFNSHVLISIAGWLTLGFCVFFFAKGFLTVKPGKLVASFDTPATYVPAAMISVALLFLAKELFERSRSTDPSISAEVSLPSTVALICAALAILSIAGFFIYVFVREHHSERRALFGIAITAFLILYAVYLYFNKELPLNSPNKLVDQIAYVFAAIFFLFETRISLGRESLGGYRAFGYCAALLTAYSAIPSLAVFFIKGEIISNSIYETVVTFTLLIFTVSRLLLLRELEADEDCETYKRLAPKAKERDEAVRIADKSFFLEENEKNEDEEENANLEESSAEEAESDGVTEPSSTEPTPDGLAEEQTDSANGENKEEKEDI